jgi:hypothetical protein
MYELLVILHILLFVYWLGGDLGVFYSSKFVVDGSLSNETRLKAAKIMLDLDLIPRICMTLMLTVGGLLAHEIGFEHSTIQFYGIMLLAPFWVTIVLVIHFKEGQPIAHKLAKFDYYFRCVMVVGILASVAIGTIQGRLDGAPWLAAKLVIFSFLIFCGVMIRRYLPAFIVGLQKMAKGETMSDEDNVAMKQGLSDARTWVWMIWAGVFIEGVIGVTKPGNTFPIEFMH